MGTIPSLSSTSAKFDVAELLARAGAKDSSSRLLLDVYRSDPAMRAQALMRMVQGGGSGLNEILSDVIASVAGEDPKLMSASFQALGAVGGDEARQVLLQAVERHPVEAITQFGPAGVPVSDTLRYADYSRPGVRVAVIQTLGTSRYAVEAEQALWAMMEKESEPALVIRALGGVGTRQTAQRLEDFGTTHPELKAVVHSAKEQIYRRLVIP